MDGDSYGSFAVLCRLGTALQAQPFKAKREGILSSFLLKYSSDRIDIEVLLRLLLSLHCGGGMPTEGNPLLFTCTTQTVDTAAALVAKVMCGAAAAADLTSGGVRYGSTGVLSLKEALGLVEQIRGLLSLDDFALLSPAKSEVAEKLQSAALQCTAKEFSMLVCIAVGCRAAVAGVTSLEEVLEVLSPAALTTFKNNTKENEHVAFALALDQGCAGSPHAALERDPSIIDLTLKMDVDPYDAEDPKLSLAMASAPPLPSAVPRGTDSTVGSSSSGSSSGVLSIARAGTFVFRTSGLGDEHQQHTPAVMKPTPVRGHVDLSPPSVDVPVVTSLTAAGPVPATSPPTAHEEKPRKKKTMCRYGLACRRRNPDHFKDYDHPPDHPCHKKGGGTGATGTGGKRPRDDHDDVVAAHDRTTATTTPAKKPAGPDPKDFALKGIAPLRVMPEFEHVFVDGTAGTYKMKNCSGGVYTCSCPVWRFQTRGADARTCKHLQQYLGEEFESARCANEYDIPAGGGGGIDDYIAKGKKEGGAKKAVAAPSGSPSPAAALAGKKHPMPGVLLANKADPAKGYDGWWCSEKLDGVRAYWDGTRLLSRNGNEFTAPSWFVASFPKGETLDGELFGGRKKFQSTVSVVKSSPNHPGWKTLTYEIFDVPSSGTKPFEARLEEIKKIVADGTAAAAAKGETSPLHLVEQEKCTGKAYVDKRLAEVTEVGGEGLMLREPGSRYMHSRSNTLLKVKSMEENDAIIRGYDAGKGRHTGRTGALHCELASGKKFFVGSGLSDAQRDKPPPIGTVIVVRYQELTDGGVPRFPVFAGCRYDIDWPPPPGAGARIAK